MCWWNYVFSECAEMRVVQKIVSFTYKEEPLLNIFVVATPSYKTRKTYVDFCLNFCADEAHTIVCDIYVDKIRMMEINNEI